MHGIKCEDCGASIEMNYDKMIAFCPYCGNKLMLDINQVQELLKEKERTKQIEIQANVHNRRAELDYEKAHDNTRTRLIITLSIIGVWILSIIILTIVSVKTMDHTGFSAYQILLIVDIVVGGKILFGVLKKK